MAPLLTIRSRRRIIGARHELRSHVVGARLHRLRATPAHRTAQAAVITHRVHRSDRSGDALFSQIKIVLRGALPPLPQWSRPFGFHVCSVFARMSRYGLAVPGTRRQRNGRSHGQNGTARHDPAVAGHGAAGGPPAGKLQDSACSRGQPASRLSRAPGRPRDPRRLRRAGRMAWRVNGVPGWMAGSMCCWRR